MDLDDAGCRARHLIGDRDGKFPPLMDEILCRSRHQDRAHRHPDDETGSAESFTNTRMRLELHGWSFRQAQSSSPDQIGPAEGAAHEGLAGTGGTRRYRLQESEVPLDVLEKLVHAFIDVMLRVECGTGFALTRTRHGR